MNVFIPTRDEMKATISEAIQETIRRVVPEIVRKATAKEYLTKGELKELTGWSDRTIQNMRDQRQIPFSQHGKKILYPYTGIMEFLEANHIKPHL